MTRRIRRRPWPGLAAAGALLACGPAAQAQEIVFDPTSYAQMIEQTLTALQQLEALKTQVEQGKNLFDSLNKASGIDGLAGGLDSAAIRDVLPDSSAILSATDDLAGLGDIGRRASTLREGQRLFTPAPQDAAGAELEARALRAARDLAVGEAVERAGARRASGLETLAGAIGAADDARAVLDLQARLAAEQALIANDQTRLQGLAITRQAEAELQAQRDRERAAARRKARMDLYREGF